MPPDYQSADMLAENAQFTPFVKALRGLDAPFEAYVRALAPPPSCIVSDWCNTWTAGVARSLGIPRLFFHGPSCFYSLCDLNAVVYGLHEQIAAAAAADDDDDKEEAHVVPGMPVRVTVTKGTAPGFYNAPGCEALRDEAIEVMLAADGVVVNTFLDLEGQFVACYEAALGKPVWTVGPLCLHNRDDEAMASCGGSAAAVDRRAITAWLDGQVPGSVVLVSFGTVLRKLPKHLFEVGHGLEESGKPFLWVVKEAEASRPEFLNERLAVDVLGVGVPIGVTAPVLLFGDEAMRFGRADVARAVSALMDGGEEAEERRRKAKEYGEKARRAMAEGGSSHESVTQLIASFIHSGGDELVT
uniref:UDP-glycosyltransferases domain-containing protein n=1 Tax=Oryza brachyantha TaxID=4533 RepID=J3LAS0_ORYBR